MLGRSAVSVRGGIDGRSSSEDLPFALLAGAGGGVAIGVEWSGTWYVRCDDLQPGEGRGSPVWLEAGLWGIGSSSAPGKGYRCRRCYSPNTPETRPMAATRCGGTSADT
ncbi:hypothetical protein [Bradyrhizobium sp. 174]|uniref:hypothetical protein n=1 Tax=Bradyrhizobium sp. 174 TaxID=2782645 RepID=UPI001FFB6230|nr:hypothetical protein [Bradyrhizobium sp. 174]